MCWKKENVPGFIDSTIYYQQKEGKTIILCGEILQIFDNTEKDIFSLIEEDEPSSILILPAEYNIEESEEERERIEAAAQKIGSFRAWEIGPSPIKNHPYQSVNKNNFYYSNS